jgi:tetratricopeptide (TPR) repeat protein
MRRWALLTTLFVFIAATCHAQQNSQPARGAPASNPPQAETSQKEMTPRQIAEMRADILVARKEFAAAATAYEHILAQEPKNAPLLNKAGMAYQQLGDTELATRYYKRAMKADKHFASAVNNLGTLEYGKGSYGKAIKYYKKAVSLSSDQAAFYSNLGYAYCGIKQYAQAMEVFTKALALDPEVFERHGGVGAIIQQRSTPPDPGMLHFLVAKSYAQAGDAEHAAEYLKMARDEGYKAFRSAATDPAFAKVIKNPRVQDVLRVQPPFEAPENKPAPPQTK